MSSYFTRLTPNFNNWEKPSGRDGKCLGVNPLYEETHGFGWEEWLFEDYHLNKNNPEHTCFGFLEAFNHKNKTKRHIDKIYLYTKVCANKKDITPGFYYVGNIDHVQRIEPLSKPENDVRTDLNAVELNQKGFLPMLPYAKNISFQVKDVHVNFNNVFQQPIQLNRGQFRFALYNLNNHQNFRINIISYV
jgi:hypothetical protein